MTSSNLNVTYSRNELNAIFHDLAAFHSPIFPRKNKIVLTLENGRFIPTVASGALEEPKVAVEVSRFFQSFYKENRDFILQDSARRATFDNIARVLRSLEVDQKDWDAIIKQIHEAAIKMLTKVSKMREESADADLIIFCRDGATVKANSSVLQNSEAEIPADWMQVMKNAPRNESVDSKTTPDLEKTETPVFILRTLSVYPSSVVGALVDYIYTKQSPYSPELPFKDSLADLIWMIPLTKEVGMHDLHEACKWALHQLFIADPKQYSEACIFYLDQTWIEQERKRRVEVGGTAHTEPERKEDAETDLALRLAQAQDRVQPLEEFLMEFGIWIDYTERPEALFKICKEKPTDPFALALLSRDEAIPDKDRLKYAEDAAASGKAFAINNLGLRYELQLKDYPAAFELYKKAADMGSLPAKTNLAESYLYGDGVPLDREKGIALVKEMPNYWRALHVLAVFSEKTDPEFARATYRAAVDLGSRYSMTNLARYYAEGSFVEFIHRDRADPVMALKYAQQAAALRCDTATCTLGNMYKDGFAFPRNYREAFLHYERAIVLGNRRAYIELMRLYAFGRGTVQSTNNAFDLLKTGIDKGKFNDTYIIEAAGRYVRGNTDGSINDEFNWIPQQADQDKGFELYQIAANRGSKAALEATARCHAFGIGTPQDLDKAYEVLKTGITGKVFSQADARTFAKRYADGRYENGHPISSGAAWFETSSERAQALYHLADTLVA